MIARIKQHWLRLRHEAISAKTIVARQQLGLSHHLLRVLLVVGLLTIIAAVFPGSPFRSAVGHAAGMDCSVSIPWKDFNIDSYQGTDTTSGYNNMITLRNALNQFHCIRLTGNSSKMYVSVQLDAIPPFGLEGNGKTLIGTSASSGCGDGSSWDNPQSQCNYMLSQDNQNPNWQNNQIRGCGHVHQASDKCNLVRHITLDGGNLFKYSYGLQGGRATNCQCADAWQ